MNFLNQLDDLIKKAVNEAFADKERQRQDAQFEEVKDQGLVAKAGNKSKKKDGEKEKKGSKDEAEEEETEEPKKKPEEKKSDEKIKGDPKKVVSKTSEKKTSDDEEPKEKPGTQTSKKLRDPSPKELKQPDFKSIAKNINLLRGGKSLKDDEVKSNLKDYLARLSPDEKKSVLVYLNSLAQVMAGVKKGSEVIDPSEADQYVKKVSKPESKMQKSEKVPAEKTEPASKSLGQGVIVVGK